VPWRRTLLDKTSRRLWRTAFTVGCSTRAADTSSKARYLLWAGATPTSSSGMCIRLAPSGIAAYGEVLC
jgi:hypothetical protein